MTEHFDPNHPAGSDGVPIPVGPPPAVPAPFNPWASAPSAHDTPDSPDSPPAFPGAGGGALPPGGEPPAGPPAWGYPPQGPGWGGPWQHQTWGPPAPPPPSSARWYRRPLAVGGLVVATVGAGIGIGHALTPTRAATPAAVSTPSSPSSGTGSNSATDPFSNGTSPFSGSSGSSASGSGSGSSSSSGPSDVSSIAAKVDPDLVDINVTFGSQGSGAGTGIVLTSNGEVLTNNHVIESATSISVTDLGNGKTYSATVVGYDRTDDVAVIQLSNASGLQTAKIGDSSKAAVGTSVVAIGNAGGTGGTPTATGGSITALNQAITASDEATGSSENLTGLIETDANIQPGDSGGSLVNTSGQVVGMDSAASEGYSLSSQTSQGYAIPINEALSIASQIESGTATSTVHVGPTAYLGVYISASGSGSSTSPYSGGVYDPNSQNGSSTATGAAVSGVVSGGPAADAGLAEGDVITSVQGQSVSSASALSAAIAKDRPGQSVQIGWTDASGSAHTTTVTLGTGPAQ